MLHMHHGSYNTVAFAHELWFLHTHLSVVHGLIIIIIIMTVLQVLPLRSCMDQYQSYTDINLYLLLNWVGGLSMLLAV